MADFILLYIYNKGFNDEIVYIHQTNKVRFSTTHVIFILEPNYKNYLPINK